MALIPDPSGRVSPATGKVIMISPRQPSAYSDNVATGNMVTGQKSTPQTPPQPSYSGAQLSSPTRSPVTPVAANPQPATSNYGGGSIVDYLSGKNQGSSFGDRQKLASANGINGYTGSADQNTALLTKLRGGQPTAPTQQFNSSAVTAQPQPTIAETGTPRSTINPDPNATYPVQGNDSNAVYGNTLPTDYRGMMQRLYQASQPSDEEANLMKEIGTSQNATNKLLKDNGSNPTDLDFMTGRGNQIRQVGMQNVGNINDQLGRYQGQRSQAMQGFNDLLGASRLPISPGNGYIDANTGELIGGGSYGTMMDQKRSYDTFNNNTQQGLQYSNNATSIGNTINIARDAMSGLDETLTQLGVNASDPASRAVFSKAWSGASGDAKYARMNQQMDNVRSTLQNKISADANMPYFAKKLVDNFLTNTANLSPVDFMTKATELYKNLEDQQTAANSTATGYGMNPTNPVSMNGSGNGSGNPIRNSTMKQAFSGFAKN